MAIWNKVIEVKRNGKVTHFDYDGQGMLVGKQLSTCRQAWPDGTYERWVWDGMALIARGDEYYVNAPPITGGLPIVSLTAEGVRYHQYDPLGTTLASYTADGKPVATYKATVFGKGELQNSPAARFTGKPYDADLGAYVFPFRNYKPELARWMSTDPSGFPDGPNNHFYAPVPTMEVDPLGLKVDIYTHSTVLPSPIINHAKLVIRPDNPHEINLTDGVEYQTDSDGKKFFTLGAGPVSGNLVGDYNRERDVGKFEDGGSTFRGEITDAGGMSDTDFINSLIEADSNYADNVDYDLNPVSGETVYTPVMTPYGSTLTTTVVDHDKSNDGRNSNSYISGLLDAVNAQGKPKLRWREAPGWDVPLHIIYLEN